MGEVRRPARRRPGDVVDAVLHREGHQRVVGRMEADLVEAAAVAVEGGEFGREAVGLVAEREHRL